MKYLLCLLVWCSLLSYINSQCIPDDENFAGDTYVLPRTPDTTRGEFHVLPLPGLTSIEITEPNIYLTVSDPVDETIAFSLTDEMENFERDTENREQSRPELIRVRLTCGSAGSSLLFFSLMIDDINNNFPSFTQSQYVYQLPMPFPSNLEITQFGIEIIAEDIDFTNMGMTFEAEGEASDLFDISYDGTIDSPVSKNHKATIRTKRPLQFTQTREFTIKATDWGTNPNSLSNTTTLVIQIDEENSAPGPPMFNEPYHEVLYDVSEEVHSASVEMDITNADSAECDLYGEYADFFVCQKLVNQFRVTLTRNFEEDTIAQGGYRLLVVEAKESEVRIARTVVIVQIPEPITTTTACPTEPTETTTTCEVCEVCSTTTECATETTVTLSTCDPCECPTTEAATTCPNIDDILSTACPSTTTEVSSTVTACEPCDSTTTVTVTCPSIEDILSTACPDTTTGTPGEPGENTPCPECPISCPPIPDDCTTTEALDCSQCTTLAPEECPVITCPPSTTETLDSTTACPTLAPVECPETCPPTTPYDCTTETFDCSVCTTVAPECPIECPESTPCVCDSSTTEGLDSSTVCPTLPPVECPLTCPPTTPSDCTSTHALDSTTVCPTLEPVECSTTPCECPETSTVYTGYPTESSTSASVDCSVCPQTTTCESSSEPLDCSLCSTLASNCPDGPTECPICQTDCSECTDEICETPAPIDAVISFNGDELYFTLAAYEGMSEHCLPVSATSTIDETITYSESGLPSQLYLDSRLGMLSNNGFLPPALYTFTIIATGDSSGASASKQVTVNVVAFEKCPDGARVYYSLLIQSITENSEKILLTYPFEEEDIAYTFNIIDVSPTAGRDLFYVSEDGLSVRCNELDREAVHLQNMAVTQYTVTVTVTVDDDETTARHYRNNALPISNETYGQTLVSSRADSQENILISDIRNDPTVTIITVIVGDENDNAPVFPETNLIVGYPASTLLSTIAPAYIVQVKATDADIDANAQLAYNVVDSRVRVHSRSGIIYPTDALPDEDFSFTVTATDQNGAGLQSSNSLQVQVKMLNQEHISVITVENVFLEDIDEKILELNAIANVNIRILEASVLPSTTNRQMRADEKYYLIITAYALDSSNALVTTEQLQEALANVEGLSVVTLPTASETDDSSSGSNTGLIAAVSILGALLFLILIAILVFYYFRLRKRKTYDQMEEENANSTGPPTPPQYQKNIVMTRSSSKLSHLGHDIEKMERRPTGILVTGTLPVPDGDSPPVSPPKERRKSVVFNANVEQINIDTSRDSDDGLDSTKL